MQQLVNSERLVGWMSDQEVNVFGLPAIGDDFSGWTLRRCSNSARTTRNLLLFPGTSKHLRRNCPEAPKAFDLDSFGTSSLQKLSFGTSPLV